MTVDAVEAVEISVIPLLARWDQVLWGPGGARWSPGEARWGPVGLVECLLTPPGPHRT